MSTQLMSGNAHFSRIYSNTTASALKPAFVSPSQGYFIPGKIIGSQFNVIRKSIYVKIDINETFLYEIDDVPLGSAITFVSLKGSSTLNDKLTYNIWNGTNAVFKSPTIFYSRDYINLISEGLIDSPFFGCTDTAIKLVVEDEGHLTEPIEGFINVEIYYISPPEIEY